jgi:hypothetical protein
MNFGGDMSSTWPVCDWYDEQCVREPHLHQCWEVGDCEAPNGCHYCFRHLVSYYRTVPADSADAT